MLTKKNTHTQIYICPTISFHNLILKSLLWGPINQEVLLRPCQLGLKPNLRMLDHPRRPK